MAVAPELENWYEEQETLRNPPSALDKLFADLTREGLMGSQSAALYITNDPEAVPKKLPEDTVFFTSQQQIKNEFRRQHEIYVRRASDIDTLGVNPSIKSVYDLFVRVGGAGAVSGDNLMCVGEGGIVITDTSGQDLLNWMEEHQGVELDRVLVVGKKERFLTGDKAIKAHTVQTTTPDPMYSVFRKVSA